MRMKPRKWMKAKQTIGGMVIGRDGIDAKLISKPSYLPFADPRSIPRHSEY